jgi:hypothetical protein
MKLCQLLVEMRERSRALISQSRRDRAAQVVRRGFDDVVGRQRVGGLGSLGGGGGVVQARRVNAQRQQCLQACTSRDTPRTHAITT